MANSWLRLWHDMPNDPKWRTIARVSKQSIPAVLSVYVHLLVIASNASERGRTQNVCSEDLASALDLEAEQIDAILAAMQGRVLDGDMVSGWAKRQVEREDGSAERAKRWREAQKEEKQTQANASERKRTPDTDTDTDTDTDKKNQKYTSDDLAIAETIWAGVKNLNPNHKPPSLPKWAESVRLMREVDNRSLLEIQSVFAWANRDQFWQKNILSPDKLRKQFDTLVIQKNSDRKKPEAEASDYLRGVV